ncbi:MAG TPA: type II toxin-antitoxin system HicB family antitoxin [Anaerolineae bacterium]|nr:type II toxin-antitoxin system HicB family antitoxin [Anaerolineae bacterium]
MQVRIVVEPDEDVYVAYCPELPGCVSYGHTEEEALTNIREAIDLYRRQEPPLNSDLMRAAIISIATSLNPPSGMMMSA